MIKLVNDTEEGTISLIGKKVLVTCARYAYAGILSGVNDVEIMLTDPAVVYETGAWTAPEWKDAQKMGVKKIYIQRGAIEVVVEGK